MKLVLLSMIAPTVAAILSYLQSRRNSKQIQEIHLTLNSRLTELLRLQSAEAHAAGHAEGMAERTK